MEDVRGVNSPVSILINRTKMLAAEYIHDATAKLVVSKVIRCQNEKKSVITITVVGFTSFESKTEEP